ncbi:transient receptor potential cation channel subfamily M member 2 [Cyprinodon tularosa]|uniref:transient receptor potential cation channel subfamily M member 2 n=1 Tax=Cyprinodon tularosa TaxID=77115 RepID=UPI0018E2776E|nr:transient receptor potential cation channel subfamily M member 2 [Cyprinodon tularosa]
MPCGSICKVCPDRKLLQHGREERIFLGSCKTKRVAAWIQENIKKKECIYFQRDPSKGELICYCGYSEDYHTEEAKKPEKFVGQSWDRHKHVKEEQTDAFGHITFGGSVQRVAEYARVSTETKSETLYRLLTEQWRLSPPNLLISVTGGAKNFYLKPHLKKVFHRGIIKVAQTTGAWIITGGTHTGVMRHVGQAVRDYALSNTMQGEIVAIGVATWGAIHNRHVLKYEEGKSKANYAIDTQGQGRLSCLDNNHTHFLLVDDGTDGKYGVEIELRAKLEKYISSRNLGNKVNGVTIPVVCVVLDGGTGTLNTIYNAMLNDTPCVILEGSGRIADVIAQVYGLPVSQITIDSIKELLKNFFSQEYGNFKEHNIIEWTKTIQDIIRMSHLLTIYRAREDKHGDVDVDVAILQALLKASKTGGSWGAAAWKRQLELAIAWNRVDIAEKEIFTEESQWKSSELHWAMFLALTGNKPQFVSLLLDNGLDLEEFLRDDETLCELYQELPNCFFLYKLAKRVKPSGFSKRSGGRMARVRTGEKISLFHVSAEVRHLLGKFTKHIYPQPTGRSHIVMSIEDSSGSVYKDETGLDDQLSEAEPKRDACRDLFLWAVVHKNKALAEIAWAQSRDSISAALAASKILKKMAREGSDADETQDMKELASYYEDHAIGVFNECNRHDEERAKNLLVRISSFWGKTTCLRLALEADNKDFVAQSGVQAHLNQIWCGELSVDNPVWKVLICIFFFPLIFTNFLLYRHDEILQRQNEKKEEIKSVEKVTGSTVRTNNHRLQNQHNEKPLGWWPKLVGLYCSPQVKFYGNIVSYFAFLFLFAVVLMVDFQRTPSAGELLLYIWLFSLVCEEIRQLFYDPDSFGIRKKAKMYIHELWNILDVLSILLFCLGLGFRMTTELFYAGKVILCIDFVVFCLRLMAIFTISRTLGPKIIIIKKMMMDMFFFMFMLSIWVVAYGVAKQGILIHNENRLNWILRGAVYEPYLIIFGNFPKNFENSEFDKDSCSVNALDPFKPKCPELNENEMPAFPEWLSIIMLCVYLLFANILLLNLLIAIFNFTFQEVQDNTDKIWMFQRYELIKEYHSRPNAPPPFIIFSHLRLLISNMFPCCSPTRPNEFKKELKNTDEEELLLWESLMKDIYLVSVRQRQSQSMENRILNTSQRVTTLTEQLEKLGEQITQSTKDLQWIVEKMKCQGVSAIETQQQIPDKSFESLKNAAEEEESLHVKSRQLYYSNSKIKRFPVPEEKVPWQVSFSLYEPRFVDGDDHVDEPDQEVLNKYRNPQGRTGITGRGELSCLGPNLNLDLLLTRWRDSERSVLEYLVVLNSNLKSLALPGGPVDSVDQLPGSLKGILGRKVFEALNAKVSEGKMVYKGYVDDCRNTDNAWVETAIINIHLDRTSQIMVDINNMLGGNQGMLQWQEVSSSTRLSPNQRVALDQVAALHIKKL